jgi:hypothetical protein
MAGSIVAAAKALADQLKAAGVRATHDPAVAAANRPCVLVPPPAIDYRARTNTWRLVALAGKSHGDLAALDQLDDLVQLVVDLVDVETADPGSYVLTGGTDPVPAYILRLVT